MATYPGFRRCKASPSRAWGRGSACLVRVGGWEGGRMGIVCRVWGQMRSRPTSLPTRARSHGGINNLWRVALPPPPLPSCFEG